MVGALKSLQIVAFKLMVHTTQNSPSAKNFDYIYLMRIELYQSVVASYFIEYHLMWG